jgi:hypothetical protein
MSRPDSRPIAPKLSFNIFDAGQAWFKVIGQCLGELILGNTHGLMNITQGVVCHQFILVLAKVNPNSWLVAFLAELAVNRFDVEVKFPCMFRLKIDGFWLDYYVAVEPRVVEEQVDEELPFPHLYPDLPPDVGKPGAEFQQKLSNMFYKTFLEITLVILLGRCQKVEDVRVLERLPCKVGLGFRECYSEIVDRSSLALIEAAFYLMDKHPSAPVVDQRVLHVVKGLCDILTFRHDCDIVSPGDRGDLGNELLHELILPQQ